MKKLTYINILLLIIFNIVKAVSAHETFLAPEMVKIPGGQFIMGCVDGRDTVFITDI